MRGMDVEAVQGDGWWEILVTDGRGSPLMRLSPAEGERLAQRLADQGHHDLADRLRYVCAETASRNAQLKKIMPNSAGNFVAGRPVATAPARDGSAH